MIDWLLGLGIFACYCFAAGLLGGFAFAMIGPTTRSARWTDHNNDTDQLMMHRPSLVESSN